MNAQPKQPSSGGQAHGLAVGVSFYQVLEPSSLVGPGGTAQYAMYGPFANLVEASQYAASRVGAFVTVTLILHQTVPVPKAPPMSKLVKG